MLGQQQIVGSPGSFVIMPPGQSFGQGASSYGNKYGLGVSSGQPNANQINFMNDYGTPALSQMNSTQGLNGGTPGQGQGSLPGGLDFNALIQQWMKGNADAKAQNQTNWDTSANYLKGLPGQYANDPVTKASNSLTQSWLSNPEALNDHVMNLIKNQTSNQITAQGDNAYKNQAALLNGGGDLDMGSLGALKARIDREGMAQQTGANTQLEIQRAQQRNQDYANALSAGRQQSQQNIAPGLQVGQSIISNLPQNKGDDLGGMIALLMAKQNQDQQNYLRNQPFGQTQTPVTQQSHIGGHPISYSNVGP